MSKFKITIIRTGTAVSPLVKQVSKLMVVEEPEARALVKDGESFIYDESKGDLIPIRVAKESLEDRGATIKVQDAK